MQETDATRDEWAERLAAFATTDFEVDEELRRGILVRVVDTFGTALGATGSDASDVVERYAGDRGDHGRHTVWGTSATTDVEQAALVNGVKARYLDFNDAYYGMSSCHPSDIIPTLFAGAVESGADEATFLRAIAIGYEAIMAASDVMEPRLRGFDHVQMTILGALTGSAHVMGLTEQQARHAVGLGVTSHVSTRQSRTGQLSMWKAFAAPDACRHGLYSCRLAACSAEGPIAPFTGLNGAFRRVMGWSETEFPVLDLEAGRVPRGIIGSQIKKYPCGSVGQSAAQAGEDLVEMGLRLPDVAHIDIRLDPKAYPLMVSPEKLAPRTRETADHSIPYLIVSALKRGMIDVASFEPAAILDEDVHAFLASSVTASEDPALAGGHERGFPIGLTVTRTDGSTFSFEVERIPGTPGNEMSDDELREKFRRNLHRSRIADRADELWDTTWSLGTGGTGTIDRLGALLRA